MVSFQLCSSRELEIDFVFSGTKMQVSGLEGKLRRWNLLRLSSSFWILLMADRFQFLIFGGYRTSTRIFNASIFLLERLWRFLFESSRGHHTPAIPVIGTKKHHMSLSFYSFSHPSYETILLSKFFPPFSKERKQKASTHSLMCLALSVPELPSEPLHQSILPDAP